MNKKEKKNHTLKWNGAAIAQLKTVLRNDKHARLDRDEGIHLAKIEDVKNIKPMSQEMQQWMQAQCLRVCKQHKAQRTGQEVSERI